jgi:magnesium-transporting ATPase (P-type)
MKRKREPITEEELNEIRKAIVEVAKQNLRELIPALKEAIKRQQFKLMEHERMLKELEG